MNWEAIGAVGEIVGAVAVVATLLYLASQTRHTRTAVESSANIGTAEAHSRFRQALMTNADLADLLARVNADPDVTAGEQIRLRALFHELFIACAIGIMTNTNERTPRTDVSFLVEFLHDNPYGLLEWQHRRDEMLEIVPEFCREIDLRLGAESGI
jgi:hypothetical protein